MFEWDFNIKDYDERISYDYTKYIRLPDKMKGFLATRDYIERLVKQEYWEQYYEISKGIIEDFTNRIKKKQNRHKI